MNIIEAMGLSVLGMVIVFVILVLLMAIIYLLSLIFGNKTPKNGEAATNNPATTPVPVQPALAPGSAGEISIFEVPDKEAAMIMAIIADKLDAPLNELHFKSIREVK